MFKYVKYILVVMVLGMGLIAFNQIAKADNEVVDVGENISFRQIDLNKQNSLWTVKKLCDFRC